MKAEKGIIRCKIKIVKIYYPKDLATHMPGDWASFAADVLEEKEGEIKTKKGFLRLSGPTPSLDVTQEYTLTARYAPNEKYGDQYNVLSMNKVIDFTDPIEQRQFLEHTLTEAQVNSLYEQLSNPFEVIKNREVETLCTVKGIGKAKAENIIDRYYGNIDDAYAYVQLDELGLSDHMIAKLIEKYNSADTLVAKIKENPYVLIDDIDGIGWKKADAIALGTGIGKQSVQRIKAFIYYYLSQEAYNGNTWTDVDNVIDACTNELQLVAPEPLRKALYELNEEEKLWWNEEKTIFALPKARSIEQQIADELYRLQSATIKNISDEVIDIKSSIKSVEDEKGIEYTEEQRRAIELVLCNNVSIITGYGGTGKSTVVAAVLDILKGFSFAQTALSGRAAARLSEITSKDGYTIHRLLKYSPKDKKFEYNHNNQLPYDIIILDEVSMVGAELFYDLIQAVHDQARLIMIGDDGQLESIGMCNIFKDMLASGVIPVARLTQIHRQAAKSAIITESIKVRTSRQIIPHNWVGSEVRGELHDLELDIYGDSILSQKHLIDQFERLYAGLKTAEDIQIVLPQKYRGEICTTKINTIIQGIVNPGGKNEFEVNLNFNGGTVTYALREGDKVIVNKNNYDTMTVNGANCPVYNGNKGMIKSINKRTKKMIVDFEQWGEVIIPYKLWSTIELAYALSCHKLQGSEADYVIVGLDFSAKMLLTREWLYTAITRAKKKCIICAETKALSYSITNTNVPYKRTFLHEFLVKRFSA